MPNLPSDELNSSDLLMREAMERRLLMGVEIARKRLWLAAHHHRNSKKMPLEFGRFPYLRQLYADVSDNIVLQTGTQTGKTEWCACDMFALIALGLDVQNVQPKDELRAMFLRSRIIEPIKAAEYYDQRCSFSGNFVRWEGGGTLRITFSNVANEMIAFPADSVSVDEVDFCDLNNLNLLPDRMMNSPYRIERRTSTPTVSGHSGCKNIAWYYDLSDRKKWHVPCPSCKRLQQILWETHIVEEKRDPLTGALRGYSVRDTAWEKNKRKRDLYPICPHCGDPMDRLSERGVWIPENPDSLISGYQISKIPSPMVQLSEMVRSFEEAQGSPTALMRFWNSYLGLVYKGAGDKLTRDILQACVRAFHMSGRSFAGACSKGTSMGVDVGEKLDVRISDHPDVGVRRARFIGKVRWEDLDDLVRDFNVKCCVIDEEPERSKALEFQAKAKCRVITCLTRQLLSGDSSPSLEDLRNDSERNRVTIDRTIFMDRSLQQFVLGKNWLPTNWHEQSDGWYEDELLHPTRILEVTNQGRQQFVWTSGKDHSFLADVYDLVAANIHFPRGNLPGLAEGHRPFMSRPLGANPLAAVDSVFDMDVTPWSPSEI